MDNSNQPTTQGNDMPLYDDEMILGLFNNFIEAGGMPKVTAFKKHLDELINVKVKPLCSSRGKSPGDEASDVSWRSQQKAKFAGRGAKWVQIALEQIEPTLKKFETDGIDCSEYRAWTEQAGYAWVRYSGPRVSGNVAMAAFEVRTEGSKKDHPKQLHLRYDLELMEGIEQLEGTPHAMGLEILKAQPIMSDEEDTSHLAELDEGCEVIELSAHELNPYDDGGSAWAEEVDDESPSEEITGAPDSDDPEAWDTYLNNLDNDNIDEDAMSNIEDLMAYEDEEL